MAIHIGQVLVGRVSGIQPYGVFVSINKKYQGLIHISECGPGFVADLTKRFSIGELLSVKVIDIDEYNHQISLSIRALASAKKRSYRQYRHYWTNQNAKTGFAPIASNVNKWVHEALQKYPK